MSTTIKVDAVTREPRIWQGKTTWGVKLPGDGGWITLYREQKPNKGDTLEVNITERNVKGRLYVDAFPVMPPLAPATNGQAGPATTTEVVAPKKDDTWSQNSGTKVPWKDCIVFAGAAHDLASQLEPDTYTAVNAAEANPSLIVDRSTARAAILNTLMIAFTGGKIIVPKDDDGYVPPVDDDDVPF